MNQRPPDRDAELLSDPAARRLLARASELDATSAAVADLRAAATEAGISAHAFDAALAEMRNGEMRAAEPAAGPRPRSRQLDRGAIMGVAAAAIAALIAIAFLRTPAARVQVNGAGASKAVVEEAIQLRCISGTQAADLIRPQLGPAATIRVSPASSPNLLTVRGTPEELQKVRSVLDRYEGTAPNACPVPPAGTVKP